MKFLGIFTCTLIIAALTGCAHNLYFVGRKSGDTAQAVITTAGNKSGDVTVTLKNKTYSGRWVYMANGGMIGFGTANAFSGPYSAFGTSTMASGSLQGNGTLLASAEDGTKLRCIYNYNEWGSSGVGECNTSDGEIYDLQIN